MSRANSIATVLLGWAAVTGMAAAGTPAEKSAIAPAKVEATVAKLVEQFGATNQGRIRLGVTQVAERWWPQDGDDDDFGVFCEANFLADPAELARTFARLERVLEQIDGHLHEIRREVLTPLDLDTGAISAVDQRLAGVDLAVHTDDDLFKAKVAHLALLNFPVHSLADRLAQGPGWDRETWARSRMMDRFAERVPASVLQGITSALTAAEGYVDAYNIRMDRLVTADGRRLFPEGLRLISHWGLRDELASHYGEPDGLAKQRMIAKVMDRIVRQQIPAAVIDNPDLLWCPDTNEARPADGAKASVNAAFSVAQPDRRYAVWLANFHALAAEDPYTPIAPTAMARSFEQDRQIPEKEVEALLVSVLGSPEVKRLAALISKRLGRPLEPFDIWYAGFKPRASHSEADLDRLVSARYPTVAAFQSDLPNILTKLGFAPEKARWLAAHIIVDPSRGAGHAMAAIRREDLAHLRTRIPRGGMNYKGYNIAIHELGHNVEQTFSLQGIDHWFLAGVPNSSFTEALAFTLQARDLELLGLASAATDTGDALGTLWATYEIGGVALVDMRVWDWLYAHPQATPDQLRDAVLDAARQVWNTYYAPLFGVRDQTILAIYSHMLSYPLYLPDYPIAHIIAFQVADRMRARPFGAEFERMARQGRLTPDAWMKGATGGPTSAKALLSAARTALASAE